MLIAVASPALAQSGLRMENALPVASLRSGGPLYVMGELQWDRPDLLEGRLRFTLRNGPEVLAVVETDPIVIVSGGRTRFRQLLPVPEGQLGYGMSAVTVEFLTDEVTFSLGEILVTSSQRMVWQVVALGIEPTPGAGLGDAERLHQEIAFEKAMPDPKGELRDGDEFGIRTSRPILPVADLPEQPLAYCAFDTVLLPREGLTRATGRQLTAISDWVRAGGAVCVAVDGPLEQKQAKFFDELFRDSDAGPFIRDDEGRLLEPEGTTRGVFARPAGLGVAVVVFGPMDEFAFDTPAWREAHARLWRLREQYVAVRRNGNPITAELLQQSPTDKAIVHGETAVWTSGFNPYQRSGMHPRGWTFPASSFGTSVVESLRPESIRLMPGWAVVLILFGYVALVGPLDYLVLGRLRLRKWTWLTFPAVTLAVTWSVVATSNSFMSDNDHVRSVDVVDLDAKGEPVRRSRLDLHFRGSTEPVVHELERAYFTRLDPAHFQTQQMETRYFMRGGVMRPVSERQGATDNDAPTGPYVGTIASRYVVPQQIAKWTPQVNRIFEIAPKVNVPKIDWAALEQRRDAGPSTITLPGGRIGNVVRFGTHGYGIEGGPVAMASGRDSVLGVAATAALPTERWSLQFQRSPLGLGRLDDLPFVDVTAEGLDAIVFWTTTPDGSITIYRKPVSKE
ncbi:MAG: hypothetical protein WBC44_10750 [Planctomycetaceae bacterium]